jgi:hypothetical protein
MKATPQLKQTYQAPKHLLKILAIKPLSTGMILKRCGHISFNLLSKAFIKLRKQGKIEMIGFYNCQETNKPAPYFLSYYQPLQIDQLINPTNLT